MRRFIQIFDFTLPHNTGLVFEVNFENEDRFWVKDIVNEDGSVFCGGGWLKSICYELSFQNNDDYCNILLERTKKILQFQKDK